MKKKCPNCLCMIDADASICSFCKTSFKENKVKNSASSSFSPPRISNQEVSVPLFTKIELTANIAPPKKEIIIESEIEKELKQEAGLFLETESTISNNINTVVNDKDPFTAIKPEKEKKMLEKIYEKVIDKAKGKNYLFDTIGVDTRLDALGFVEEDLNFKDLKKLLPQNIISDQSTIEIKPIEEKEEPKNFQHHVFEQSFLEVPEEHLVDIDKDLLEQIKSGNVFIDDEFDIVPDFTVGDKAEDSKVHSYNDLFVQTEAHPTDESIHKTEEIKPFLKNVAKRMSDRLDSEHPFSQDPFELDSMEIAEINNEEILDENEDNSSEIQLFEDQQEEEITPPYLPESIIKLQANATYQEESTLLANDIEISQDNKADIIYHPKDTHTHDLASEIFLSGEEVISTDDISSLDTTEEVGTSQLSYFDNPENYLNQEDISSDKYEEDSNETEHAFLAQENPLILESISLSSLFNQDEKLSENYENILNFNSKSDNKNISNEQAEEVQNNLNNRLKRLVKISNDEETNSPFFNMDELNSSIADTNENIHEQTNLAIEPEPVEVTEVKEIVSQRLKRLVPKDINPEDNLEIENKYESENITDEEPSFIIPSLVNEIITEPEHLEISENLNEATENKIEQSEELNDDSQNSTKQNDETENEDVKASKPENTSLELYNKKNPENDISEVKKLTVPTNKVVENVTSTNTSNSQKGTELIRQPMPILQTNNNPQIGARSTSNQKALDHYTLARDLCVKRDYQKALIELEESVKIDPAFEQAHILLSRTYLKLKNTY